MRLGYNTNGMAHHDPMEAIELLAELGFESVAITVDHPWLSPKSSNLESQLNAIRKALEQHGMGSVIETGARFLLDPKVKHFPTLMEPDDGCSVIRSEFLKFCIRLAAQLNSDCVSLWSGAAAPSETESDNWNRLSDRLGRILDYAEGLDVVVGFEPEPGMFIDTVTRYGELKSRLAHSNLKMTLDVGHLHCLGELPIEEKIRSWSDDIVNVHIEDMRLGVHDHLMFGEGEIDFPPVIQAFADIGYSGGLHVELSRHSHNAVETARASRQFLAAMIENLPSKKKN